MQLRFYITACFALWTSASLAAFVVTPIQPGVIVAGNLAVADEASRYDMTYYSLAVPANVLTVAVDQISGAEVSINPRGRLPCSSLKYDANHLCTHKWTMGASDVNATYVLNNGDEAWSIATTWFIGVSRGADQNASSVIEFTFRFAFNVCAADQVATIDNLNVPMCANASAYVLGANNTLTDVTAGHIVLHSGAPITTTNYEYVSFSLTSQSDKLKIALRSAAPPSISGFGNSFDCTVAAAVPTGTGTFNYAIKCDLQSGYDFYVVIQNTDAAAYSADYTVILDGCPNGGAGTTCTQRLIGSDRIAANATIVMPADNLVDHVYFDFAAGTNDTLAVQFAAVAGTGKIIARRNGPGSATLRDFAADVYDLTNETLTLYLVPEDLYEGGRYFFTVIADAAGFQYRAAAEENDAINETTSTGSEAVTTVADLTTQALTTGENIASTTGSASTSGASTSGNSTTAIGATTQDVAATTSNINIDSVDPDVSCAIVAVPLFALCALAL